MMKTIRTYLLAAVLLMSTATVFAMPEKNNRGFGVYQYVVEQAEGDLDAILDSIKSAAGAAGWQVLADVAGGVPEGCKYRTHVLVLADSAYADQIMQANRVTGPFAVVDRVNVFEDERGVHVSVVNPHSINRTVLMDDEAYMEMTEAHLQKLRGMITSAVKGTVNEKEYGQFRKKGYIGKTMGVMAGGKFIDKLVAVATVSGQGWQSVAARVREGLSKPSAKWGMHRVYELALPDYRTVVFGTTGTPMDSKSFSIVRAGSDKSRKKFKCPGLAHAGAYPIEVVVAENEDGSVSVRLVETMFRMKMYFEDAGKWAFMKNMRMPGSIQKELVQQIRSALQPMTAK
ncbi:MAG: hypothetical protein Q9P90_03885 [candidate division KSB1 bacterium]|nr:hypothetical protein [candidate division KSB1 bacterium]